MENKHFIWIWPVTEINWEHVRTEKTWGVDDASKSKKISKGDVIVFYVRGTGYFRGIFRASSDWHQPTVPWPDGRKLALEIDLEEIETGYCSVRKLAPRLEFISSIAKIGIVLKGLTTGPANFGKSIGAADYGKILAELKNTKSPEAIGKQTNTAVAPEYYNPKLDDSPIRLHLIKRLFEELLGPKNGPSEEVENVGSTYVVGILRTKFKKPVEDMGADPSYTVTQQHAGNDESITPNDEEEKMLPDYDLNPLLGARSMGLSFVVEGAKPKINVCFTWGRYDHSPISKKLFRRQMNYFVADLDLEEPHQRFKPEDHPSKNKLITKSGVEIDVITSKVSGSEDMFHVSIFLINDTPYAGDFQTSTEWVFQPQIRVNCAGDTRLGELDSVSSGDPYDAVIYSGRKNRGRGHLCGTVWKEVDPEDYDVEGFSTFNWPDSKSAKFPEVCARDFTRPDIRTEFFPTYSILQPDISNDDETTNFDAEKFSNIWNPDELESALSGIANRYEAWIAQQGEELEKIQYGPRQYESAKKNLENCTVSKERILEGIDFLKSDEKARLAFCFMNRVIHLKSKWEGQDNFSWREFQMAFILQCIKGVAPENKSERDVCDILWFPTGGGKTEAYLGLTIFTIAFRRLLDVDGLSTDGGVSIISRYTLRLLTIQQFQRAVAAITAADFLRVTGWIPRNADIAQPRIRERASSKRMWGERRISIGLLIGGDATPNRFKGNEYKHGAEETLQDKAKKSSGGEPSQVLNCPCCKTILAVPSSEKTGLEKKDRTMHWIFSSFHDLHTLQSIPHKEFGTSELHVSSGDVRIRQIGSMTGPRNRKFYGIRISFKKRGSKSIINGEKINQWWKIHISDALSAGTSDKPICACTSPSRPGYFFVKADGRQHDFSIFCPNPDCELNAKPIWFEGTSDGPMPLIPKPFQIRDKPARSLFMPIPAFTVDDQIYRMCPSMIISTVDKFAMLPFMEDFASIFGNVDTYDEIKGYGRSDITNYAGNEGYEPKLHAVQKFLPPSLVIQDELHLIEGPLGSMVGAYEIAFDILSTSGDHTPKYIASSATIKEAQSQVGAVYRRRSFVFPPQGISVDDNYFSKNKEDRESLGRKPGRLYVGICAPQKILTVPVRIWATLLSEAYRIRQNPENYGLDSEFEKRRQIQPAVKFEDFVEEQTDPYWTLIGYFNAKRELQISRSLYEDDIKRDVKDISCEKISSINFQKEPLDLVPGLRFFPIRSDRDMDISKIVVYCDNSKGKISVAIFNDSGGVPGNRVGSVISDHRTKPCTRGPNEFHLEEPIRANQSDLFWISVTNSDRNTRFETGNSSLKPRYADISATELDGILDSYRFPSKLVLHDAKETVRILLASNPRNLGLEPVELTGNTESQELPNILKRLDKKPKNDVDAVFTTSVFGTGIDIQRLGLMIVMGQPKTTASYIQSTGRVGRRNAGIVITWYKAANIRDLNHYEDFVGYHRMLQRFVEPISASPFSEEALRLCLGPVLVSTLRNSAEINGIPVSKEWIDNTAGPMRMKDHHEDRDVIEIYREINRRLLDPNIPVTRRPSEQQAKIRSKNTVGGWQKDARFTSADGESLRYFEWTMNKHPENNVVLGTQQHDLAKKTTVFKNVRTSMREVESTANFGGD